MCAPRWRACSLRMPVPCRCLDTPESTKSKFAACHNMGGWDEPDRHVKRGGESSGRLARAKEGQRQRRGFQDHAVQQRQDAEREQAALSARQPRRSNRFRGGNAQYFARMANLRVRFSPVSECVALLSSARGERLVVGTRGCTEGMNGWGDARTGPTERLATLTEHRIAVCRTVWWGLCVAPHSHCFSAIFVWTS